MQNLIITTKEIKKELLLSNSKKLFISNDKIMTKNELKKLILSSCSNEAVLSLKSKFKLSLNKAKVYADNVIYKSKSLSEYYDFLIQKGLLKYDSKIDFKSVLVINEVLDDYTVEYLGNDIITYKVYDKKYNHPVYYFDNFEKEILFICEKILSLNVDFSKVKLVGVKNEYYNTLKRMFKSFNIPLNIDFKTSVSKTNAFINFYDNLSVSNNLSEALKKTPKGEVYTKIVEYFNKNDYKKFNASELDLINEDFKNIKLASKKIKNAVEIINYDDIFNEEYYYFVVGFNDEYPKKYKDEDFFSDEEKIKLKVLTSYKKNELSRSNFLNVFYGFENMFFTYSKQSTFTKYNESNLVKDLKLEVINNCEVSLSYSNEFNKVYFAKLLDLFSLYGVVSDELLKLNKTYDIEYKSYDNSFTNIDKNLIKYPFDLSYSSVKTYYECAFKYYVEKILCINSSDKTLATIIGNTFHLVLSKMYEDGFDYYKEYENALLSEEKTFKEKFFLNNLAGELEKIISFLRDFDSHTSLKDNICENRFLIKDIIKDKINFKGFIDNIKYDKVNQLMVLIDYKTGNTDVSLDNINHGFNLQLPSYMYLVGESMPEYKVVGAYLDSILQNPKVDEKEEDSLKKLKFSGYTTSNLTDLENLDSSYDNSRYIKSLKTTSNGFYAYSKVLDDNNFLKVRSIAEEKILKAAKNIENANFEINPKEIKNVVEKCKYCKYKDLCFMKNEDVQKLENTKLKDIL